jgi:hypothetical protein
MSDLTITCTRCKNEVGHVCNDGLMPALVKLLTWKPEDGVAKPSVKRGAYYRKGDETAPFMSEAFLYNLLGKEDARTLLALVNQFADAAGLDRVGVHRALTTEYEAMAAQDTEREEAARRQVLLRKLRKAAPRSVLISVEDWPVLAHLANYPDRWQVVADKRHPDRRRITYLGKKED